MTKPPKETLKAPVTGKPLPRASVIVTSASIRPAGWRTANVTAKPSRQPALPAADFRTYGPRHMWANLSHPHARETRSLSVNFERFGRERMAERDADRMGHLPALLSSDIASLKIDKWTNGDVRDFRDTMLAAGLAKGTVVKRVNMIAANVEYLPACRPEDQSERMGAGSARPC